MIKKLLILGGSGLTLLAVTFGQDAFSYVSTAWSRAHGSVRGQIPVEFELERARRMVDQLEPEVRRNMHTIAKEEVAIERLQKQIAKMEEGQSQEKEKLMKLSQDLEGGETHLVYAGQRYTAEQVREDLANRFDRYKTNDETLANLRRVLNSRTQSLEAARKKLDEMFAVKQQLLAAIANLEARQTMVELAQTSSEVALDDSRLSRTKQLIDDIETRIKVSERLVTTQQEMSGGIPVGEPTEEEISAEVAHYFDQQPPQTPAEPEAESLVQAD